jgi:hypothetical protein
VQEVSFAAEARPGLQVEQDVTFTPPVKLLYVPAGQPVQALAYADRLAKEPAVQFGIGKMQALSELPPVALLVVDGEGQAVHAAAPELDEYVSCGHVVQTEPVGEF